MVVISIFPRCLHSPKEKGKQVNDAQVTEKIYFVERRKEPEYWVEREFPKRVSLNLFFRLGTS